MLGFCFTCGAQFVHDDNGPPTCLACTPPITWGVDGLANCPDYVGRGDDVQAPFTVLVDTREQRAYTFRQLADVTRKGTVSLRVPVRLCTIPAGDYSIDGYAAQIAVERKTLPDFLGSFGGNRDCEERKLAKLAALPVAWYVLEFTYGQLLFEHVPHSRVNRKAMSRSIMAYQVQYPTVHWFFAGERAVAESLTYRLLEKWWWDRIGKPMKEAARLEKAKGRV